MPIQESSATALVRLTGLAIICLNQKTKRCEIGLLRDNKHELTIKVLQPGYEDGSNDIVRYHEVVSYNQLPKENVRVSITTEGAPVAGYSVYQNGTFDRVSSTDLNDFRWLVDMQSLHKNTLGVIDQERYPLSKVYLDSGLLYTHQLDQQLEFDQVTKDANGVEGARQFFGRVAKTLGAHIEGAQVSLMVQIGADKQTTLLPRVPNLPSIIEIKNINYDLTAAYSDMPDYYKYMASPLGNQIELKPAQPKPTKGALGRPANQEDFCHPVVFPLGSIDKL